MKRRCKNRGIALVEMAIVLPLLLMGTLGAIHYGLLLWRANQVTHAARTGVRVAVRAYANNTDVATAIDNEMDTAGLGESEYTWSVAPLDVGAVAPGDMLAVTVRVSTNRADIGWLRGLPFLPTPANLEATISMPKEGP